MKIDFSNKEKVAKYRSLATKKEDIMKFDVFLSEVKVFDFNNESHVNAARTCCTHCCENVTIENNF
jgi:hypothetical protein